MPLMENTGNVLPPTAAQLEGWQAIRRGENTLIAAPTGSGKTLAAFLTALDQLLRESLERGELADEVRVIYVSPLKALSADIHKNLAEPRREIRRLAEEMGYPPVRITAAVRSGDTPQSERAGMLRKPPHILVTTPESLYLLLTAERSREMLKTAQVVIVDEIHAVLESRRGAHLALSLERLEHACGRRLQRIGLSATQKPIEVVAQFLVGSRPGAACAIVNRGHKREVDLAVEVPGSPLEAVMSTEVWTEIYNRLVSLVESHRTTLIMVNTRRLAERMAHNLTERLGAEHVAAHHGSLSKEKRLDAEQRLREGTLKVLVSTASLELGIDIGHVDLVCQISSPNRIATLLQRVGRSGHTVRGLPKGRVFPLTRDDLIECAARNRLTKPANVLKFPLIHVDDRKDWTRWLEAAGVVGAELSHGPVLNRVSMAIDAAVDGQGIALARTTLAATDLISGRLLRPFAEELRLSKTYWIICPTATAALPKIVTFRDWLLAEAANDLRQLKQLGVSGAKRV